MKQYKIIIGKNFGDEGKGLATDYFARTLSKKKNDTLIIKHNGGAQAGHTVEHTDKRFVFHQLSSGSFYNCPTFLSDTFLPDFMKIGDELLQFKSISGISPEIYIDSHCRIVLIYDVLVNIIAENSRGISRHGSCGMGINEAVVRNNYPEYGIDINILLSMNRQDIVMFMKKIRDEYVPKRLDELNIPLEDNSQWSELLKDDNIAENSVDIMLTAIKNVNIIRNPEKLIATFDNIIFEGAQGLMLDRENIEFFPHLTPSHTGCINPFSFLDRHKIGYNRENTEICYISRTYVTKHGAGFFPYECNMDFINPNMSDMTNIPNEWQQTLRFGQHGNVDEFLKYILTEKQFHKFASTSLFITHLNETGHCIISDGKRIPVEEYISMLNDIYPFETFYLSDSRFSNNTKILKL